jgi:hypothetical protein
LRNGGLKERKDWSDGVMRFRILECGIWILLLSSYVLSVFQSPILNPRSKISSLTPVFFIASWFQIQYSRPDPYGK